MSEQPRRVLLGDITESQQQPPQPQATVIWTIIRLVVVGMIALAVIQVILGATGISFFSIDLGATGLEGQAAATQSGVKWALSLFGTAILMALWLSSGRSLDASQKPNRLFMVVTLFLLAGVIIASAAYLVMVVILPSGATLQEQIVLPGLVMALFAVLALFSPWMPIWRIVVPDDDVWMILDSNGLLQRYVEQGVYYIQPIQGYARFDEKGIFTINFDSIRQQDDRWNYYLSRDSFPYRVRVYTLCAFNPMYADRERWASLRTIPREGFADGLRTQIRYAIRRRLMAFTREQLRLNEVLNVIAQDIDDAIQSRASFGIRRLTNIEISIEPPQMVVDARGRRMVVEALGTTDQRQLSGSLRDLLQLAGESEVQFTIDEDGHVNFTVSPNDNYEIGTNLEEGIRQLAGMLGMAMGQFGTAPQQQVGSPQVTASRSLGTGGSGSSTPPSDATQRIQHDDAQATQAGPAPTGPQPAGQEQASPGEEEYVPPKNPIGPADIIEMDEDSQGIYVPRHPMGPEPP
ncbi:MAG: hypothetical protein JW910_04640 [Anaerolineae bacterium]|nr:hypothetical protein [Anaerolineae bacterium]